LLFDAPEAAAAPTRRSSRSTATPIPATAETAGASRAELRRRLTQQSAVQPTLAWDAAADSSATKIKDDHPAEIGVLTDAPLSPTVVPVPVADLDVAPIAPAAPATRRSRRAVQVVAEASNDVAPAASAGDSVAQVIEPVLTPLEPFELLEPSVDDAPALTFVEAPETAEQVPTDAAADRASRTPELDAFEAAARLFSFTGETTIQYTATREADADAPAAEPAHVAPRRNRGASFKRVTAASFSVSVMGIVGLLTVGLTTPADAVAAPHTSDIGTTLAVAAGGDVTPRDGEIQAYVTPSDMQNAPIQRAENYSTLTMAQLAADSGISNFSNFFINNPNSPIQWPFAVGVPISYGFGMRDGTMHEGADFTPGEGSPIQAIADGVVRESTDSGGAFGVHIVIDHVIDGVLVSSSYSHMLYGSRQVQVGDHVTVGTIIGHTGNTGRSYGAHTHFEILANGTTPLDPISWLREHAGG
jgi:murein DD-endopeptidase MepM/ murein hydrolase activator NlpD